MIKRPLSPTNDKKHIMEFCEAAYLRVESKLFKC